MSAFVLLYISDGPGIMLETDLFLPRNADNKYLWEAEKNNVGGKIKVKYEPGMHQTRHNIEFKFIGNAFLEELVYAYFPINSFNIPWEVLKARVTLKG